MERVAFLIEETGERLSCLLNPESLEVRRRAGVRPRPAAAGRLAGRGLSDDPLLDGGGGITELRLDLLFDVSVAGSRVEGGLAEGDVRRLTAPLWDLAEHGAAGAASAPAPVGGPLAPAPLRRVVFFWGKAWSLEGVVAAVAERLEHFTAEGVPRRSWLRLRLLRTERREVAPERPALPLPDGAAVETPAPAGATGATRTEERFHRVLGDGDGGTERPDQLAAAACGDPRCWRLLMAENGIDDPLHLEPGRVLHLPSCGRCA